MVKGRANIEVIVILQVIVAVFLVTIGLAGIIQYGSDVARIGRGLTRAFGGTNNSMNLIISIIELAAGTIVIGGVFFRLKSKLLYAATLVIAVLWLIQIVLNFFAADIFEPDFIVWLNRLAGDLIVLVSLWLINRRYA